MVHPEDYPRISASVVEQIDASDDNMDYVEYRIIRKDGAVRRVDDYGHYLETDAMDIQMPVMNGYEATRAIRSLPGEYYRTLPIIAMSANAYDEDIQASLDSGMNAHIAKPFQPDDLIKTLYRYMAEQ